jgi:hypothetical protein
MTRAMVLADQDWHLDADLAILRLSLTQSELTADDLRKVLRPAPVPHWVGLAFGRASRAGLIEKVNDTTSKVRSRNNGSLKTWRRKTEGVAA